jgi:hypothetical protein
MIENKRYSSACAYYSGVLVRAQQMTKTLLSQGYVHMSTKLYKYVLDKNFEHLNDLVLYIFIIKLWMAFDTVRLISTNNNIPIPLFSVLLKCSTKPSIFSAIQRDRQKYFLEVVLTKCGYSQKLKIL